MVLMRSVPLLGLVCFRLWCGLPSTAQPASGGARELGLGQATAALETDVFSGSNPAGLAVSPGITAAFAVSRPFGLTELDLLSAGLATRLRSSRGSLFVERFGFSLFKSDRLVLTFARPISPAGDRSAILGFRVTTERVAIAGQAPSLAAGLGIGWILKLTPGSVVGASADPLLTRYGDTHPPLERQLRLGYRRIVSPAVSLLAQVEKSARHPATFQSGLEWHPSEGFAIRMGLGSSPSTLSFGLGAATGTIQADVATISHPWLGWTPAVSAIVDRKR